MSHHYFDSTEKPELRAKIDQAKSILSLPKLMRQLSYEEKHIRTSAVCPFHSDEHPSFSVFQSKNGKGWQWKCHVGCGYGDEIAFLVKHFNISRSEAIRRYLDMAGFPARVPPKSHEYPESPQSPETRKCPESLGCPESPMSPVYPMSNGQTLQQALKASATRNACKEGGSEKKALWQLARDLVAVQKRSGRKLSNSDWVLTLREWHQLSLTFLDPRKTFDDYLAAFLAKPAKVRIPTGEGDTLNKALKAVAKLSVSQLPAIPEIPDAPESLRRVAALHRELSRLCGGKKYFLTCRDAAKASCGLSHQKACNINLALAQLGVIKIVRAGDSRPGGKASQFQYLLSAV
jgi:hypothetical protein